MAIDWDYVFPQSKSPQPNEGKGAVKETSVEPYLDAAPPPRLADLNPPKLVREWVPNSGAPSTDVRAFRRAVIALCEEFNVQLTIDTNRLRLTTTDCPDVTLIESAQEGGFI